MTQHERGDFHPNHPFDQKIMVNFQVENERAEMTQEVMGDMLDDAMAEDGDSDEEEKIVGAARRDRHLVRRHDSRRAGRDGGAAATGAGRRRRRGRWRWRRRAAASQAAATRRCPTSRRG